MHIMYVYVYCIFTYFNVLTMVYMCYVYFPIVLPTLVNVSFLNIYICVCLYVYPWFAYRRVYAVNDQMTDDTFLYHIAEY